MTQQRGFVMTNVLLVMAIEHDASLVIIIGVAR